MQLTSARALLALAHRSFGAPLPPSSSSCAGLPIATAPLAAAGKCVRFVPRKAHTTPPHTPSHTPTHTPPVSQGYALWHCTSAYTNIYHHCCCAVARAHIIFVSHYTLHRTAPRSAAHRPEHCTHPCSSPHSRTDGHAAAVPWLRASVPVQISTPRRRAVPALPSSLTHRSFGAPLPPSSSSCAGSPIAVAPLAAAGKCVRLHCTSAYTNIHHHIHHHCCCAVARAHIVFVFVAHAVMQVIIYTAPAHTPPHTPPLLLQHCSRAYTTTYTTTAAHMRFSPVNHLF